MKSTCVESIGTSRIDSSLSSTGLGSRSGWHPAGHEGADALSHPLHRFRRHQAVQWQSYLLRGYLFGHFHIAAAAVLVEGVLVSAHEMDAGINASLPQKVDHAEPPIRPDANEVNERADIGKVGLGGLDAFQPSQQLVVE